MSRMEAARKPELLLADGNVTAAGALAYALQSEGYHVRVAPSGAVALTEVRRAPPDLVLLRTTLPDMDGFGLCETLRTEHELAVILISECEGEQLAGFAKGADAVITAPFSMEVLLAQVRVVLRWVLPRSTQEELIGGSLRLDLTRRRAFVEGRQVALSRREFDLLAELMRHPGKIFSRALLLERLWGSTGQFRLNNVDVQVCWLRRKIEPNPAKPTFIHTVTGVGYVFEILATDGSMSPPTADETHTGEMLAPRRRRAPDRRDRQLPRWPRTRSA